MAEMELLMTVPEVAQKLNMSTKTVYRMAQEGDLPGVKIGSSWRFLPTQVAKWVKDKAHQPVEGVTDGA